MVFHSQLMLTTKSTVSTTITACLLQNVLAVAKVRYDAKLYFCNRTKKSFNNRWIIEIRLFIVGITPVEGTEETVRVVSMDKDFHVDCYVCEDCGMQLTDEPESKCYPYEGRLMCRTCHLKRISMNPNFNHTNEPICATYQYMG